MLNQFNLIVPEMMLLILVLLMQTLAVFLVKYKRQIISFTTFMSMLLVLYLLYFVNKEAFGFTNSFEVSPTISFFKALVLGMAVMSIMIYQDFNKINTEKFRFEFVTLVLLSTLGVFVAISARDFILLFCGLELQALSGYALAAFNTTESRSSEAGLKYFVLGALMSALMLFGVSLLYGYSGSLSFTVIKGALNGETTNPALVIGAVLIVSGILFKLSAVPLHVWTPDVYEGAPITVVSYFAAAQKIGTLIVLINIIELVVGDYRQISVDIIRIVAALSMIVGALGAIKQKSLKRLMAYSTILNIGYVLIGLVLRSPEGKYAAFIFMLIYVISTIGFFGCLVALLGRKSDNATFADLKGVALHRKTLAAAISIIMFSMIGLPPLAGFFGKYYVFYNAVQGGEIALAIIGVLTSVVAAFYYLKIIKFMYFVDAESEVKIIPTQRGLLTVSGISIAFIMFFFIFASSYIL